MRKLTATLCLTLAVLLGSAGEAWSLPKCPGSYDQNTWTNCHGTFTYGPSSQWADSKYVGEFRDDNFNGQGTLTSADGEVWEGIWENSEFQP